MCLLLRIRANLPDRLPRGIAVPRQGNTLR